MCVREAKSPQDLVLYFLQQDGVYTTIPGVLYGMMESMTNLILQGETDCPANKWLTFHWTAVILLIPWMGV